MPWIQSASSKDVTTDLRGLPSPPLRLRLSLLLALPVPLIIFGPHHYSKSLKPFLSSFISHHLSFDVNRNLMSLLCNVILVFVTGGFGYFGVSSNAAEDIHGGHLVRRAAHHQSTVPVEYKEVIVESIVLVDNGVSDIEEEGPQEEEDEEEADDTANQDNHHFRQRHLYQPCLRRPNDHHVLHHHKRQRGCQHYLKQQPHHYHPQLHQPQEEEEEKENVKYKQQQKLDERGGLVIIEESDERFDSFIKQVKEGMRMEAKLFLQTA